MAYTPISALPTAPDRTQPSTFSTRADAFVAALATFVSETNAAGDYIDGVGTAVDADAAAAEAAKTAAETAQSEAESAATAAALEAAAWVSGASYTLGDVVWSNLDYRTYRASSTHTGQTIDPSLPTVWSIPNATFVQSFDVSGEDTGPTGIFFKPDGTKMYVVGDAGNDVNEYDLSTPWDVSSASYLQNFSVAAQDTVPTGIFFKPDGAKMYITGQTNDFVSEYDLSTPWDISSASYLQNFSVAAQDSNPYAISFKPDGSKMYVVGNAGDDVNEYDLSTPWDVSSASFLQNFSIVAQATFPTGLFFKPDGNKMYVADRNGENVNEYDLSTPWDISSASYLQNFSVSAQETFPTGLFFKPDGTKMYVVGADSDAVHEYNINNENWAQIAVSRLDQLGVTASVGEVNKLDGMTASTAELNILDGATFTTGANGETTFADGVNEGFTTVTSDTNGDASVDCRDGNVFAITLSENTTFTFDNPPTSGTAYGFVLKVVQDSTPRTITWPASVDWSSAISPTLSAGSGDVDVFVFFTHDGGTNWYGFIAGQDLS